MSWSVTSFRPACQVEPMCRSKRCVARCRTNKQKTTDFQEGYGAEDGITTTPGFQDTLDDILPPGEDNELGV